MNEQKDVGPVDSVVPTEASSTKDSVEETGSTPGGPEKDEGTTSVLTSPGASAVLKNESKTPSQESTFGSGPVKIEGAAEKNTAEAALSENDTTADPTTEETSMGTKEAPGADSATQREATLQELQSHQEQAKENEIIEKLLNESLEGKIKKHAWPDAMAVESCKYNGEKLGDVFDNSSGLRIFACTWNMHGKGAPGEEEMKKIFSPNLCHLYAIGTQECERTAAQSIYKTGKLNFPKYVQKCLGDNYFLVKGQALAAINLTVFAHKSIKEKIVYHESNVVATGIGNRFGNKGGCGIAICIDNVSLLFIASHMAAHQHKVKARNKDFNSINTKMKLSRPDFMPWKNKETPKGLRTVSDAFHHVFWMGDFNYRINGTRRAVDKMLSLDMHEALLANDQLSIEKRLGNVFTGFSEGPLNFRPTYKYDKLTNNYDSSKKRRIPAWTDRVLWRSNQGSDALALLAYDCEETVMTSDHRAVRAIFNLLMVSEEEQKGNQREAAKFGVESSKICSVQ
jgi:hypothetical protein